MRVRGGSLIVTALLTAGVVGFLPRRPMWSRSLRGRVIAVIDGQRPFELRLSGQTTWAPCRSTAATNALDIRCSAYTPDEQRLAPTLAIARDARADSQSVVAGWSLAVIDLLAPSAGVGARRDRTDRLLSAVARDGDNAALRNDLAVAYLARGDAWSAFLALDEIERAYAIDSTSAVIAFNRAMMLDRMYLTTEARDAWAMYLRNHPESGWQREAKGRLGQAEARLRPRLFEAHAPKLDAEIDRDPQHAREYVLDSLLAGWAQMTTRGDVTAATSICQSMKAIGRRLEARSGDETVPRLAQICSSPRADVAHATARFFEGMEQFRRGKFSAAETPLGRAAADLRRYDASPLAGWGDVTRGFIEIYAGRYVVADSIFESVEREATAQGESALAARAFWGLGLSAARHGAKAVDYYSRAAEIYRRLGEALNGASMVSQAADVMLLLGRDEPAMNGKYEALSLFDRRLDTRGRPGPRIALGLELVDLGMPNAAIAVLREAVRAAETSDRANELPEALIQLASAELAVNREQASRAYLLAAQRAMRSIPDTLILQRIEMSASLALAALDSAQSPDSAIARLTEVAAYYQRTNLKYNRGVPLARRGRLRLRLGDVAGARNDIEEAAAAIEQQGVEFDLLAARDRAAAQREVYETLVALDAGSGDTTRTFLSAERARGNKMKGVPAVPRGQTVVSYFALPDKLLLWVLTSDALRMHTVSMSATSLREQVALAERLIRRGNETAEWREVSRALFDSLIVPVLPELRRSTTLTIVADGPLDRLPFAALQDSAGRYLVEQVVLTQAANVHVPVADATSGTAPVVVGYPSFDDEVFPELPSLPGAVREVRAVRAAYGNAVAIVDSAATKTAVERALRSATLFHFAGHARLVDRAPSLSHLVLAKASSSSVADNVLSASDISHMDLRKLNLVILSSCGTTQARLGRDPGQSGLSEAFFLAGAHSVISSRWEVDDDGTAELMEALHRELAHGTPAAVALRRAQTAVRQSRSVPAPLRVWAAFVYEE
jgi:CHAT domain-containing protein